MTGKGTCLHVSTICFWVAGWFSTVKLYNRIRGDRLRGVQKVTLLTLLTYLLYWWDFTLLVPNLSLIHI